MEWKNWGIQGGVALALMAATVGCMPVQPATPASEAVSGAQAGPTVTTTTASTVEVTAEATSAVAATYDDPFAYCAAVGTVDAPDERFAGEELPLVIVEGIRAAHNAEDVDLEVFQRGTVWRCLDGKVMACNVGANLPCLGKADESQEPSQPMIDFCSENPGVDYIPAVVTGRETVFNWRCDDTKPVIVDQYTEVDSQGFLEFVWHELTPSE